MTNDEKSSSNRTHQQITTLIFDVDDTLYDVGTGFTAHRNGEGAQKFMVECLNFPDLKTAKDLRDEYFFRYHSTAKALQVAEKEGRFPPTVKKLTGQSSSSSAAAEEEEEDGPIFDPKDLAEYWATKLNFNLLQRDEKLIEMLESCPLKLVAFSNGPRKYVKRVLLEMGLTKFFPDDMLFAVDDVLPACKPEKEAFDIVLQKVNAKPSECVMVEDSMKNIRGAKALGMKTILIAGKKRGDGESGLDEATKAAEATKAGDAPEKSDPAVDLALETCSQIHEAWPDLW